MSLGDDVEFELLDDDGYPSDEVLELIEKAPFEQRLEAFRLVVKLWKWEERALETRGKDHWGQPRAVFRFSTGGWSGNESLIHALNKNLMTSVCWALSREGGLHIYRVPLTEKA